MMVHNFTNNNKTNNHFSPQIMEHNKTMTFGVGNTRSKVAGSNWLMGLDIQGHYRYQQATSRKKPCTDSVPFIILYIIVKIIALHSRGTYMLLTLTLQLLDINATFNNILLISRRSVLLLDETGVSGENHQLLEISH